MLRGVNESRDSPSKGPELRHLQYFPGGIIENGRGDGAMDENWAPEGCRFMTYINGDISTSMQLAHKKQLLEIHRLGGGANHTRGIVFQED